MMGWRRRKRRKRTCLSFKQQHCKSLIRLILIQSKLIRLLSVSWREQSTTLVSSRELLLLPGSITILLLCCNLLLISSISRFSIVQFEMVWNIKKNLASAHALPCTRPKHMDTFSVVVLVLVVTVVAVVRWSYNKRFNNKPFQVILCVCVFIYFWSWAEML